MNYARIGQLTTRLASQAVVGAAALGARGYVRQTADFDLITTDRTALTEDFWEDARRERLSVAIHHGDFDDPLAGAVRIQSAALDLNIDVVVAKYKWQEAVIERAEPMNFEGTVFRVPRTSDLILLKVDAGGLLDQRDAMELLELGPKEQLIQELESLKPTLPDPLQRRLEDFLAQNSSSIG